MLVNFADHRAEKRGLRAGEEVGAVRVKDGSVVFDLEEKILDHVSSELGSVVVDQAEDDEVAVPAVHFVEAASWYDVGIGKIKQTFDGDFGDADISHMGD